MHQLKMNGYVADAKRVLLEEDYDYVMNNTNGEDWDFSDRVKTDKQLTDIYNEAHSLKQEGDVTQTDRLIAIHNLTEENLSHVEKNRWISSS